VRFAWSDGYGLAKSYARYLSKWSFPNTDQNLQLLVETTYMKLRSDNSFGRYDGELFSLLELIMRADIMMGRVATIDELRIIALL